jgi:hypothetical protein
MVFWYSVSSFSFSSKEAINSRVFTVIVLSATVNSFCHNKCQDIAVLEDVVQDVKSSHMFSEIESLIDEMIGNVGKIRQNRETNLVAAKEQKQMIKSERPELHLQEQLYPDIYYDFL